MRRNVLAAFAVILFVSPAGAVDFGWEPLSEGGIEYQVQIEPQLVDSFRREGYTSEVPPGLRDIRRIHIAVGSERLPNQGDLLGPKVAKAAPPASDAKPVEQKSPPAQPQTFGEAEPKREALQANDSTKTSAAESPPPLLDPARHMALPFFQTGPAKKTASESNDAPGKPNLKPYEGPAIATSENENKGASRWKSVEAGMPATPVATGNTSGPSNHPPSVAVSKPWPVLMLALLALFASLGANVYLTWIHQEVRAKYRTLVTQLHGGPAAA